MPAGLFIQFIWVDRFPILQDDVGLPYHGKMAFKDGDRIIHADGDDGTAGFFRDLKRTAVKGQQTQLLTGIAGPLRKDTDGDPVLDIVDGLKDGLQTFLGVVPVQKEAVDPLHPVPQQGIAQHLFFGDIPGQPSASGIGKENVKITSVITNVQDRLIRYVFLPDHGDLRSGDEQHKFKGSLHQAQTLVISGLLVETAEDSFEKQDRNAQDQI